LGDTKEQAAMSLWAHKKRILGTHKDPVAVTLRSALTKASQALKVGHYDGKRMSMVDSGNVAKSIASGTKALQLFLTRKAKDIRIIQLLAQSEHAISTYEVYGVCTVQNLLTADREILTRIKKSFEEDRMVIPLLVRIMTDEVLAQKLCTAKR
jgi:hypothetical protein